MLRLIPAMAVLVLVAASPAAAQRGEAYCNVTGVTSEQISNGVRVTIEADGELDWHVDWHRLVEEGAMVEREYEWGTDLEPTEKFRMVPLHIRNARSKLGSAFVPIDKYPISHAEISIPEWAEEGVGLEVDVVNYLGWVTGEGEFRRFRWGLNIMGSEDSSSIILAWESDRFPPPKPAETPEDLPEELSVVAHDGLLDIRAVNAKLREVTNAIGCEAGFPVASPADSDLRVSVCLDDISAERALEVIAKSCGLCAEGRDGGGWVVAEASGSASGYGGSGSRRVELRYLRALDAVDLLPNFLLEYVNADEEGNAVVVSGPEFLLDRVAEDLAKLDIRPPEVYLEAVVVEYTSGEALSRALGLGRTAGDLAVSLDSFFGGVRFLWLGDLPQGWDLVLDNLELETSTRLRSRAYGRVLNGHAASLAAGQEHFVILERVDGTFLEAYLTAIPTGTSLVFQPLVGDGDEIMLQVTFIVRNISGTDPRSGLPIVAERRAGGHVRVRDGETIVVAGVRMEQRDREDRAIPILGDLPVMGELFRATDRSRSETELAFFVTPHILRTPLAQEGEPTHG